MGEFVNFITKGIEIEKQGDRRIFSGHISAEIVDHQNEFIFVKEIMKVMETFMKVLPVLSDAHTNRMVGMILKHEKSEIEGHASVKVWAEVFKQEGVTLYDTVWNKIKDGTYNGLSMGGGSKAQRPMLKNGRYVQQLADLELYEIAACPSPANPLALIDKINKFAKTEIAEKFHNVDGRNILQCSSVSCSFEKMETHEYKDDGTDDDMCDKCGGAKSDNVHQMQVKKGTDKDEDLDLDNEQHGKNTTDSMMEKGGGHESNEIGVGTEKQDIPKDLTVENPGKIKKQEVPQFEVDVKGKKKEDVEKQIGTTKYGLDSEGMKAKPFDKDPDKVAVAGSVNDAMEKHHQVGLTEEQEYGDKKKKEVKKIYVTGILEYLKYLDTVIEKNNVEILELKQKLG